MVVNIYVNMLVIIGVNMKVKKLHKQVCDMSVNMHRYIGKNKYHSKAS